MPKQKKKRICSVTGCNRRVNAKGLCSTHYCRERTGSLRPRDPIRSYYRISKSVPCHVKGCKREARTRRMCLTHYGRWRTYGNVFENIPIGKKTKGLTLPETARQRALPSHLHICPRCGQAKLKTAFGHSDYRRCRQCERKYNLKSVHGITPADYQHMLAEQAGRCALCGTDQHGGSGKHFAVDHDHQTGVIRGLLCQVCNRYVVGIIEKRNISIDRIRDYLNGAHALKR